MGNSIFKKIDEVVKPELVRDELVYGNSEDLNRRRTLIWLSALGILDFTLITLLQTGVIRKLPDLPGRFFDTNGINTSKTSYLTALPDAAISNVIFSGIIALAAVGGSRKASRQDSVDVLLGAAVLGHVIGGTIMTYDMIAKKKKVCLYCLAGAGTIYASAAVIAPTVLRSFRRIFGRK